MQVRNWAALVVLASTFVVVSCSDDGGPTDPIGEVTVETEALAEGIQGRAYSQDLEATGGSGVYDWDLASGTLPAGVTLTAAGIITGTPTAPGTAGFRVRATDSTGRMGTADLSLAVTAALVVQTAALADAVVGFEYNERLVAEGGRPDYVWSLAGGDAEWLTVSAEGAMEGTADAAGSHLVTVAVTDASGQESMRELALVVRDPVTVKTASLPEASEGRAYGAQLEASGGDGAYAWNVAEGALPAGLSLSAAGAVTGSPQLAGTFPCTVAVVDGAGRTATGTFTLVVEPMPTIRTTTLSPGTPGVAYSAALEATGGTGAYTWGLAFGALPAGLTLGADGVIAGTPSAAGSATFRVRVTDEAGATDTRDLTLTVVTDLQPLESGVAVSGLAGEAVSDRYFMIDVPAGSLRLTVSIFGGTGDADLYVRHGALPLNHAYDCRPLRQGNGETCTFMDPAEGGWYIRVHGFAPYDGLTLAAIIED